VALLPKTSSDLHQAASLTREFHVAKVLHAERPAAAERLNADQMATATIRLLERLAAETLGITAQPEDIVPQLKAIVAWMEKRPNNVPPD